MNTDRFLACIRRLHPLQPVLITFTEGKVTTGVTNLLDVTLLNTLVTIDAQDKLVVVAVQRGETWVEDRHRTLTVQGLFHAGNGLLMCIAPHVQEVFVREHAAQGLLVESASRQLGIVRRIIEEVVDENLCSLAEKRGLYILEHFMKTADEFPGIEFTIHEASNVRILGTVVLDGWSGRISVNGTWGDAVYLHPKQLQDAIRSAITRCLTEVTVSTP